MYVLPKYAWQTSEKEVVPVEEKPAVSEIPFAFLPGITENWQILSSHFLQQVWTVARTLNLVNQC